MSTAPSTQSRTRRHFGGFSIVTAIFLLVVLAALGAAIVIVSTAQQIGSALDLQGSRAYQAARAGIEWGAYQLQATPAYSFGHASDPSPTDPNLRDCAGASGSFSLPATATTLSGFKVTVTCTAHTDSSGGPTVYEIQSTACNQPSGNSCPNTAPGVNYVERRLRVTL